MIPGDKEIRTALRRKLERDPLHRGATLIDELGLLQGDSRIDLAVLNGSLEGYEIKSARDTLKRLDLQIPAYNMVLDYVSIVASPNHLDGLQSLLPHWWGVFVAQPEGSELTVETVKQPDLNPIVDPKALVQLLWRDEALEELQRRGRAQGIASKPRNHIWHRLVEHTTLEELKELVREKLKSRLDWRVAH